MISRRNIRVKVMQMLYIIESANDENIFKDLSVELRKQFDKTNATFIFLLYNIAEIAKYAEADAKNRANKNLPTAEDLQVNTKLAGNKVLWLILESNGYKKNEAKFKPALIADSDLVKKIYQDLITREEYLQYIHAPNRDKDSEKAILSFIFNSLMLPNENFTDYLESHFNNWDDDGEMLQQLVNNLLGKPKQDIEHIIEGDKWDFAENLLLTTTSKKQFCLDTIKPKLQNWDSDRIAVLDMILMQMGICEMLYFETIPTKVTINEYIDLAKEYSTPHSGQFVNGILDNIHKELSNQGKINKVEFKKAK